MSEGKDIPAVVAHSGLLHPSRMYFCLAVILFGHSALWLFRYLHWQYPALTATAFLVAACGWTVVTCVGRCKCEQVMRLKIEPVGQFSRRIRRKQLIKFVVLVILFALILILLALFKCYLLLSVLTGVVSGLLFWLTATGRIETLGSKVEILQSNDFCVKELDYLSLEEVQSLLQLAIDLQETERADQISQYLIRKVDNLGLNSSDFQQP